MSSVNKLLRGIPAWAVYLLATIPGVWWFWLALQNQLGADPAKALELKLGEFAIQLLILGLLITPLRDLSGVQAIKFRRAIGLMAFYYALAHVIVYLILDQQLWWEAIIKDITKRPYIILGVVSFIGLVPLALTSNNWAIRKIGPILWRRIHWCVYAIAICAGLHFVLLKKTWQAEPLIYLTIVLVLVGYRAARGVWFKAAQ